MFDALYGVLENLVMNVLPGAEILEYVDQYFIQQNEVFQVLMVIGVAILAVLGIIQVIKSILKMTGNILKFVLLLGIAYYVIVIVMGVNIWGVFGG